MTHRLPVSTTPDFSLSTRGRTRRRLLTALPALAIMPTVLAQNAASVAVRRLHSFTIRVSDVDQSLRFYQDLFAAPVQARQGETVCLRIGEGPGFFALEPVSSGEQPGFAHIGLTVADFDVERVQEQLTAHGIRPGTAPADGTGRLDMALQSWVVERGPARGGAIGGTRELYFADAEGVVYHLMPEDFCGGAGPQGTRCERIEPLQAPGFFELVGLSHFTNFMANRDRANSFITRTFGKSFQAYQGPGSPVIGVGDGLQFLMYVGGSESGRPANPGRIDHVCFSVENFDVESILGQLSDYGLRSRQDPADTQPLMHWISMRMPNRGGAEGGTPELYFTDPDGIRIQLQDAGYCGGSGYLGDSCPALD